MGIRRLIQNLCLAVNRHVGHHVPMALRKRVYRFLYPPGAAKPRLLNIDIVGSCNLPLSSCPVGNMGAVNPTGLMDRAMFERIIRKARHEHGVAFVNLFNWAEPFLHPDLAGFIRVVKAEGLYCTISSNLNIMKNIEEVLRAGPDDFRISLSGFTQETYGVTHARGDIERVKTNMTALSEARRKVGNTRTGIHVYYHKYRNNLHEIEPMRRFAASLGFDWLDNWAFYMPLERVMELAEGTLPAKERQFVESQFALPIARAVAEAEKFKDERCQLLEDQYTLNVSGDVNLCCSVYDYANNTLGHFLDMSEADLQRAKSGHPTCSRCANHGIHVYNAYHDHPALRAIFDRLVEENLANPLAPAVYRKELPVVS